MRNYYLFALISFLFFAVSCKRTVEGETKNFEANLQMLQELSAKYPGFKNAVEALRNDATKQMETAKGLSDEKAKIEAMSAANKIINNSFAGDLNTIDSKMNAIRDLAAKAAQTAGDDNDKDAARVASRSGEDAIREAQSKLSNASASTPADAAAIVGSIMSNLSAAENRLGDVVRAAESKKAEEKKAEEDQKTAEDQKAAEEEKKKQPIKCGHCGTSNPAGSTKCGSCNAPLS